MRKFIQILLLSLLTLSLGSCGKNAFTLEGNLQGGEASTLYLYWRAASGTRDFLASQPVPLTSSGFKIEGPAKKPTVIWIYSAGKQLLTAIYVERGNSLTLSGMMDQPELWQVKGNEVMEQVTDWQSANQAALQSRSPQRINAAVSEFVQKNPDERAALFLLLTRYDRSADPAGYQKLLKFFTDEDMIEQMQFACLEPSDADLTELPARQQQRIRQVLEADSIAAANPPSAEQLLAAQDSLEALQSESPQR